MKRMLVAVLLLASCGSKEEPAAPVVSAAPQKTIQAAVVEAKPTSVPIRVEVTGQVAPLFQATLSSRIQGTINKLLVQEGTQVSKGQLLIQLDSRDLQADLARSNAEVENAKSHLDRMNQLYAQDAVSKQEMENATRAYRVAEANRKAVEAQLSYTAVRAPFDGVITEKKVEAGELASPGQPLLRMEDPLRLRLEATVAEGDLKSISRGGKIQVAIDALGGQALTGTVSQILPAGDPQTHTFMVKVDLPKTVGLKAGMFGRFQLDKGMTQTILVPRRPSSSGVSSPASLLLDRIRPRGSAGSNSGGASKSIWRSSQASTWVSEYWRTEAGELMEQQSTSSRRRPRRSKASFINGQLAAPIQMAHDFWTNAV